MPYDLKISRLGMDPPSAITVEQLHAAVGAMPDLHLHQDDDAVVVVRSLTRPALTLTLTDGEIIGPYLDDAAAETILSLTELLQAQLFGEQGERYARGLVVVEEDEPAQAEPKRRRLLTWNRAALVLAVGFLIIVNTATTLANAGPLLQYLPAEWRPVSHAESRMVDQLATVKGMSVTGPPAVVLIVEPDFNLELAKRLARRLEAEIGRPVLVESEAQPPFLTEVSGQADVADIAPRLEADYQRLLARTPSALMLVLTHKDINNRAFPTRYLFSLAIGGAARTATPPAVLVMSAYRLIDETTWFDPERIERRLLTMALRGYAELMLGFPRSSEPGTLMYAPLMSASALDDLPATLPNDIGRSRNRT